MKFRTVVAIVALAAPGLAAKAGAAETAKLVATRDVWISSMPEEENFNMGAADQAKLKGIQEMVILEFDASGLKGRTVRGGWLWLHNATAPDEVARLGLTGRRPHGLRKIGLSTVSSPWVEGKSARYGLDDQAHGATFRQASYQQRDWAYPGSDFSDVSMGNGHTRQFHTEIVEAGEGWLKIQVAPDLIQSVIAGDTYGLCVMDESGQIMANSFVHTRESAQFAPYLVVELEGTDATPPPAPPATAEPAPSEAHIGSGAIVLQVVAPAEAFCYFLKVDGQDLPPWQIPLARPGQTQTIILDDLKPDTEVSLELVAADAAGNRSQPTTVRARSSSALSAPPQLPAVTWKPKPQPPQVYAGKLQAWAFPEACKVDPINGALLDTGQADAHMAANCIWEGATKTVRLPAVRGEIVAFQLCVSAAQPPLQQVAVRLSDLAGPDGKIPASNAELFTVWYVKAAGHWQGEYAIPLTDGQTFAIPNDKNKIPEQRNQAVYVDLLVPKATRPGTYSGAITVAAKDVPPLELPLRIDVYDFVMPDELNFNPELNCYQGPGRAGSKKFLNSHRLAHKHRATINRLPYGQASNVVHEDMVPPLAGQGASQHVASWEQFDQNVGPLLDGSAFRDLPRGAVPVKTMYLPFFESWPNHLKPHYRYEGLEYGRREGDMQFLTDHALAALPPEQAFDDEYKAGLVSVVRDFLKHVEQKGWTRTAFECYMNNKWHYRRPEQGAQGTSWWLLDEPMYYDDWQALAFFGRLFKQGSADARIATFWYRGDISRPQWQRNWMDGLMNVMYVGGTFFDKAKRCQIMARQMPCVLYCYGSCNPPADSNLNSAAWCIRAYLAGADGVLPWDSLGDDECFETPAQTGLIVDGSNRFGNDAIASLRVKALRRGAQDCELLIALAAKNHWTREQVRALAAAKLAGPAVFKQRFQDEAAAISFGRLDPQLFAELREGVMIMLAK